MKRKERHLKNIFLAPFDNFLDEFVLRLTQKFENMYHDECNRLHFVYFLSVIKIHINCRLIYGHLFWCRRKGIFEYSCRLCTQVVKCDILDTTENFGFCRYYYHGWSDHFEEVFASTKYFSVGLNKEYNDCRYFENVSTAN